MAEDELKETLPILEFDSDKLAIIRPHNLVKKIEIPERCVITFFADEMKKLVEEYPSKIIDYFKCDAFSLPIYEIKYQDKTIALMQAMVGSPVAARQIEDLTAKGCSKYMICGDCGVLDKKIVAGHLILPIKAVRDEGTSYHYIKPAREIEMDHKVIEIIANVLDKNKIPYLKAKTWTTDAFYRETRKKTKQRKKEGCLTVEMETATYLAVAKFNNVKLGQILYTSDNLDEKVWERRKMQHKMNSREHLLKITIECCLKL